MSNELWKFRSSLIVILTPILLAPLPIAVLLDTPEFYTEAKCGYIVGIMAIYWMTEAIPLSATALLPAVLMPLFGIMTSGDICKNYLKDSNMLFVGGLMVAVAVEHWNLHKRIALRVLTLVGAETRWLMAGVMLPTWFLSMWISNTATAAMMIPIVEAVLQQLEDNSESQDAVGVDNVAFILEQNESEKKTGVNSKITDSADGDNDPDYATVAEYKSDAERGPRSAHYNRLCKCLCLCVAYSASIGGMATLTGTPPNVVMSGQLDTLLTDKYAPLDGVPTLNFSTWMVFAVPVSVICLVLAWVWLQMMFCMSCKGSSNKKGVKEVLRREFDALGPVSFAEVMILIHFVVLALMWLTRDPGFVDGWGVLFNGAVLFDEKKKYVTDSTSALLIPLLLFAVPSRRPNFMCCRAKDDIGPPAPVPSILDWDTVQKKLPWNVVILLGGGFAMADAVKNSGLADLLGKAFVSFKGFCPVLIVFLVCLIIAIATEISSNTATATLIIPVLAELAGQIGVHPYYLIFPATLSTSFAFMLPVATPPNAIVFSYGHLKVKDMVMTGIGMNVICLGIVTLAINTWGKAFFELDNLPMILNLTTTAAPSVGCTTNLL